MSCTSIRERGAVKQVSVEGQLFSELEVFARLLSRACTCAVCSVWLCGQHEAPLHPGPSTEAELHRGRESDEIDQKSEHKHFQFSTFQTQVLPNEVTLFIVCLSRVEGEDEEENFSLERGFIPNSSLILLKTK